LALAFTGDNFKKEVLESDRPVLVDFTAAWCPPCRQLAPVIDGLAKKYSGKAKVGKVDIDAEQDLAVEYGITAVPTILFFKGGEVVSTVRGYNPESVFVTTLDGLL
jgi:thioredoxin 1